SRSPRQAAGTRPARYPAGPPRRAPRSSGRSAGPLTLAGRAALCARVGQRREDRLDALAVGLERRRGDDRRAELLDRVAVHGEAGPVAGDLEEHAAGLAEVDRVEVVAIDDARRR